MASSLNIVTQKDCRVLILVNKMAMDVKTSGPLLNLTAVSQTLEYRDTAAGVVMC